MSEHFLAVVAELRKLHKAGRVPALYVDSGVIRILWPADQAIHTHFRRLTLNQAERLIFGEPIEHVLAHKRCRPGPEPARKYPLAKAG